MAGIKPEKAPRTKRKKAGFPVAAEARRRIGALGNEAAGFPPLAAAAVFRLKIRRFSTADQDAAAERGRL